MRFFKSVALLKAPRFRLAAICSAADAIRYPSIKQKRRLPVGFAPRPSAARQRYCAGFYPAEAIA
jgi:hypothetical protein